MENKTSHKKSILNFNAAEWKVEKPVARPKPVVNPKPAAPKVTPPRQPVQQPVMQYRQQVTQPQPFVPNVPVKKKKSKLWLFAVIFLAIILIAICVSVFFFRDNNEILKNTIEAKLSSMKDGDIIEFGSYPQSRVTDSDILSTLEEKENSLSWTSFEYCYGDDDSSYGYPSEGDYMQYADVEIEDKKYRAVKITEYRPYNTPLECSSDYSYQDENGYYTDDIYWFEYEPLKWKVLDAEAGLLLCENVVSSIEFEDFIYDDTEFYANDEYVYSSLDFYCSDFYDLSFSLDEKGYIMDYDLGPNDDSSIDYAFALSYDQASNSDYGFSEYDGSLKARSTDYAECQGVYTDSYNNAYWWLRTGEVSDLREADVVTSDGVFDSVVVNSTFIGFRPAIMVSKHP